MKKSPPSSRWFLLAVFALCTVDFWAAWRWHEAGTAAEEAHRQLTECEQLAERIEGLRQAPVRVEEAVQSSDTLARLVENAAREVGLDEQRIVQIAPDEPRRLGDSPYQEQATEVELRQVTLRQLIELGLAVRRHAPGMSVPQLSLRVPPGEDLQPQNASANRPELWNVQLVLTTNIYAPKIPASHP